jgi:PAS domain S-box-containing protein
VDNAQTDTADKHKAITRLQASEESFRILFSEAPVGININRNGRTILVNKVYAKMFGYENVDELKDTMVIDQVAPVWREKIADKIHRRYRGEKVPTSHETLCERKDGSYFQVFVQVDTIMLADGEANIAFFTDITTQKQAEDELYRQINAQELLLQISQYFSNINTFNIDAMINLTLKRIGEFDYNDRSYVFLFSDDGAHMSNTYEWCAEGIKSEMDKIQNKPTSSVPWIMTKLLKREKI